ncbi:hypothetical protein BS329_26675 [Amycolatopsis coloradensis]|uniref:Uncharacterized protein n=1 Tax=Amycolatopsis coloradensis TaxID=76021 RepID=A0A1R0KLE4_9PSEU|nr:hypothetical protein BS329_26675 [Amycolatopsis coloradensis]
MGPLDPPPRLAAPALDVAKATFETLSAAKATFETRRYHSTPTDPTSPPLIALSYPQPPELSTDRLWVTRLSDTPDTLGAGPSPGKGGGLGR